ncbi:sulfatase family protein [Echinicola vietnamensis]|uniref:Arylsulfatase A family protein n=1 Tax=Echinicola vietnamensis (strain DSM 17526 / LMG 23754 / KMM 6221) TaxID=926556 RepID=L0FZF0_ECHVK|nr:arylsulfatase [Echinicola vietnamensis]AGA78423.1 arylsulfatase A family protein [Echinicola vietnamensis DSM 17526]
MNKTYYLTVFLLVLGVSCSKKEASNQQAEEIQPKPNVLVIYTDDLGYGDVAKYGGQIPTPHIDQLAEDGMLFTNAYATAATCTPSRYAMLTGEYAWRAKGRGVAPGDASALIRPGRETLPAVMQRAGYRTGVIGKWHLGLGGDEGPDWNGELKPGPLEIGFDYSFIIPATGDRVPTVFVEDHHVVGLDPSDPIEVSYRKKVGDRPTGKEHPELLKMMWSHGHNHTIVNGVSRIGYMAGGESALWRDEDFAQTFVDRASQFITQESDEPFFLYFATHDIHVPRIANEKFQGTTGFGPRGDVIAQLDWTVGELVKLLKGKGLEENTMIIFSSDNGPVLDDGYEDQARELIGSHKPWGALRGGKYSAFEAGTRVPFIVKWPASIKGGKISNAMVSQVDLVGSFAEFLGQEYNAEQAVDTQNAWSALIGEDSVGREGLVQEALFSNLTYIRRDGHKLIPANNGPDMVPWGPIIETGFSSVDQLFNITDDPGETKDLAAEFPELVKEMKSTLQSIKEK